MIQTISETKLAAPPRGMSGGWRVALAAGAVCVSTLYSAWADASNIKKNGVDAGTNDLQAVINGAALGDVIDLTAGATFDRILVPNKTTGNGYIVIRSANLASLPAGERVSPGDAANMPKIVALPGGTPFPEAIRTDPSAHHYRFQGIEITSTNNTTIHTIVRLGSTQSDQTTLAAVPHHIDFDRCYIHALSTQNVNKNIQLHTSNTSITNCYISENHSNAGTGDENCIWAANGPGPYFIVNNYLEGAGENFMTGGGGKAIAGMLPADFTFRRNHFKKPLAWRTMPEPNWKVKNLFEIKFGRRYHIEGNLFDTTWWDAQALAISFKVENQDAPNPPDYQTSDIQFANNWVRHMPKGILLQAKPGKTTIIPGEELCELRRVNVINNLWTDINDVIWGTGGNSQAGCFAYFADGGFDYTFDHNTAFHRHHPILFGDGVFSITNLTYTNNLTTNGPFDGSAAFNSFIGIFQYGQGTPAPYADNVLNNRAPSAVVTNNVLQNHPNFAAFADDLLGHPTNWLPTGMNTANANDVRFVNFINGGGKDINSTEDLHLRSDSLYRAGGANDATDGKQVGADIDVIDAALGGEVNTPGTSSVVSGVWTANEIVLHAKDAPTKAGAWVVNSDATAAGGASMHDPNTGAATVSTPLASPSHYFQMTFSAEAGIPYRLWIHGKADSNGWASDSCWVQFDKSDNATGGNIWRIGSTSAHQINIEDANGAGLSNWGWQDDGYLADPGSIVYFETGGPQTIRIQRREDGLAIDQVVLSPCTYLGSVASTGLVIPANCSPGTLKDDTTILEKTAQPVTITLKNGVNSYTGGTCFYVNGGSPTSHFGPGGAYMTSNLFAGTSSSVLRGFYKFDLNQGANAIPSGVTIISAKLRMKLEMNTSATTVSAYRMAPTTGFTVNYAAATRNTYNGTNQWTGGTNAGDQDHLTTADSAITPPAVGQWLEFDVKNSVQAFVNGTANNGWVIKVNSGTIRTSSTNDSAGSSEYAELIVDYQ